MKIRQAMPKIERGKAPGPVDVARQDPPMLTELQGQIERITYSNEETGFTIARVKVHQQRDLVTVVGNLAAPFAGAILTMEGQWVTHPKFGEQFKVARYHTSVPASVYGIRKYLGSGLIKGIGPVMAKRIVGVFGEQTLDIIEGSIARLAEVEGIGEKRVEMIRKAWQEQKEIRGVMLFLQGHGVGSGYATKIFKHYGNRSIEVVSQNPYRLATDIFGIGFVTADRIAQNLGFAKDSLLRVQAGILYVLNQLAEQGHAYYPYEGLVDECREVLRVDREMVVKALGAIASEKRIVIEDMNEGLEDFRENHKAVYLAPFYACETGIAARMRHLLQVPKAVRTVDSQRALEWVQGGLDIRLAPQQTEALRCALESKAMVITGGPGTGKTTIIKALLKIVSRLGVEILLAAPTGRAAKRMAETTGHEARTIHRMLEYSIQKGGFQRNETRPLDCDLLIVDEASMIDTVLMHHLLKAVPLRATLILVGDVNQLPSVGPGNVLRDVIVSGLVPVVRLTEIFRQASQSAIIVNAHKINNGCLPSLKSNGPDEDFYFIEQEDPETVVNTIVHLAKERIPRRFGFDPFRDIQVLTPMHRAAAGAANLNLRLQEALNPGDGGFTRGNHTYRVRDRVMQIKNNYDKEIFNGDIGTISSIDRENQEVILSFEGRDVAYDYPDLDEITLAYAVSVHKSQGSEYPAVIVPVVTQHYVLLQRNLLYTAVTRGKKLVVLVGTKKALALAVKNDKQQKRYTYLWHRLK